jgi:hypothetical protein
MQRRSGRKVAFAALDIVDCHLLLISDYLRTSAAN